MVVFGNINLIKHLGSNCGSHSQAINGQVEWNNYPKLMYNLNSLDPCYNYHKISDNSSKLIQHYDQIYSLEEGNQ